MSFSVLERELSSADGELTELSKPRRGVLFAKHRAKLEALYAGR